MTEKLQGLLEKIRNEGLQKAEESRKKLIAEAEKEASEIVITAKKDAAKIIEMAKSETRNLEKRAKIAIQQVARDILLALKEELKQRLNSVINKNIAAAMTPELMRDIIIRVMDSATQEGSKTIKALVSQRDRDKLVELLLSDIGASFKEEPEIFADKGITGGIKVGLKNNDVFWDCSDEAIRELISTYVSPQIAAIIDKGE